MRELIDEYGLDVVQAYMQHIQVGVTFLTHRLVPLGGADIASDVVGWRDIV